MRFEELCKGGRVVPAPQSQGRKLPEYRNDVTDGEYYGEESGDPQSKFYLIVYNVLLQGWPPLLDLRRRVAGSAACVVHPEAGGKEKWKNYLKYKKKRLFKIKKQNVDLYTSTYSRSTCGGNSLISQESRKKSV